jgi:hypothetical protein
MLGRLYIHVLQIPTEYKAGRIGVRFVGADM